MADVCFQYDNGLGSGLGAVVREKFEFGELPIMLMVGLSLLASSFVRCYDSAVATRVCFSGFML